MKKLAIFLAALALITSNTSYANTIATCGESSGYGYYPLRNLVDEKNAGWQKDKISGGKITLTQNEQGDFDVLILSASNSVFSSRDEGGKVIPITLSADAITVSVVYLGVATETYAFQVLKNQQKQVIWTQTKTESPVPKIAAFVAECDFFNFDKIKKNTDDNN